MGRLGWDDFLFFLPRPPELLLSLTVCTQVTLLVVRLPKLSPDEYFHCAFGDYDILADVNDTRVTCRAPPPDQLPPNPADTGVPRAG